MSFTFFSELLVPFREGLAFLELYNTEKITNKTFFKKLLISLWEIFHYFCMERKCNKSKFVVKMTRDVIFSVLYKNFDYGGRVGETKLGRLLLNPSIELLILFKSVNYSMLCVDLYFKMIYFYC